MDLLWRGGSVFALRRFTIPDGYSYTRLVLHVLLPVHPPSANQSLLLKKAHARIDSGFVYQSILNTVELRQKQSEAALANKSVAELSSATSSSAASPLAQLDRRSCGSTHRIAYEFLNMFSLQTSSWAAADEVKVESQSLLAFYQIPMVSFVIRGIQLLVHMALCGLQMGAQPTLRALDAMEPRLPALTALEVCQLLSVLSLVLDRLHQNVDAEANLVAKSSDMLSQLLRSANGLFLCAFALRAGSLVASDYASARLMYEAFGYILAAYSMVLALGLLKLLSRVSRPFGVLVIAIDQMLRSIDMYLVFSVILMLAAGFAFFGLARVDGYEPPEGSDAFGRFSWYMLPAFAFIAPPFAAIDEFKGGAALFMLVYLFFTTKVLQSLVMAIFATAHSRVFNESENEYVYESHRALFEYRHVLLRLPPPLNMPIILWSLGSRGGRWALRRLCSLSGLQLADADLDEPSVKDAYAQRHTTFARLTTFAQLTQAGSRHDMYGSEQSEELRMSAALKAAVATFRKAEATTRESTTSLDKLRQQLQAMQQQQSDLRSDMLAHMSAMRSDMMSKLAALETSIAPQHAPSSGPGIFGVGQQDRGTYRSAFSERFMA